MFGLVGNLNARAESALLHLFEIIVFLVLYGILLQLEFLSPLRIFEPPGSLDIDLSQLLLVLSVTFILQRVPTVLVNVKSIGFLDLFYHPVRRSTGILLPHDFVIQVGIHFLFLLVLEFFVGFVHFWLIVPERVIAARVHVNRLELLRLVQIDFSPCPSAWLLLLITSLEILTRSIRRSSLMGVPLLLTFGIIPKIVGCCIDIIFLLLVVTSGQILRMLGFSAVILLIAVVRNWLLCIIICPLTLILLQLILLIDLRLTPFDRLRTSTRRSHSWR